MSCVPSGPTGQRVITPEIRILASRGHRSRPTTGSNRGNPSSRNRKPAYPPKPSGPAPKPFPVSIPARPPVEIPVPTPRHAPIRPSLPNSNQNTHNGSIGSNPRPFNPMAQQLNQHLSFNKQNHNPRSPPIHQIHPPPPPSEPPPDNQPSIRPAIRPPIARQVPPVPVQKPKPKKPQVRALYT